MISCYTTKKTRFQFSQRHGIILPFCSDASFVVGSSSSKQEQRSPLEMSGVERAQRGSFLFLSFPAAGVELSGAHIQPCAHPGLALAATCILFRAGFRRRRRCYRAPVRT